MTYAEEFNPLLNVPDADDGYRLAFIQSQVRSVVDSYHGRLDAFAEAIQNGLDALERRWTQEAVSADSEERPRLRVILDFDQNSIEVLDNGTGIAPDELARLLEPFVSDKRFGDSAMRGHKGVGTTFLAYGHPYFEVHTRTQQMSGAVGYRIEGGRAWATSDILGSPPPYRRVAQAHPSLASIPSGTYVRIGLGADTALRNLRVLHDTPVMWREVLRSNTAIGNVVLGPLAEAPEWANRLVISLEHRDGTENPQFAFPLPHLTAIGGASAKELQWLQNNPGALREFELIYASRDHEGLRRLLADELNELENLDDDEAKQILEKFSDYEVAAYASLAYKNTYYEEQFRALIQNPNAKRLSLAPGVGGGIAIASVGMPMGSLQSHMQETMLPQERRRYFLLLHFNRRYSPDIGRKTVPQELEPLVLWLEDKLLRLLRSQSTRLLRDGQAGTRPRGSGYPKAVEEVRAALKQVEGLEAMDDGLDVSDLVIARTPHWEAELVAQYIDLLVRGVFPGYTLRAVPGASSRYDALFDYELNACDQLELPESLTVHADVLTPEGLALKDRWLEFKLDINDLVDDLEAEDGAASKKYFNQIDVVVVWSVSALASDTYSVTLIEGTLARERYFVGSTHLLTAENNDHRVEVIEIRTVIGLLAEREGS